MSVADKTSFNVKKRWHTKQHANVQDRGEHADGPYAIFLFQTKARVRFSMVE